MSFNKTFVVPPHFFVGALCLTTIGNACTTSEAGDWALADAESSESTITTVQQLRCVLPISNDE